MKKKSIIIVVAIIVIVCIVAILFKQKSSTPVEPEPTPVAEESTEEDEMQTEEPVEEVQKKNTTETIGDVETTIEEDSGTDTPEPTQADIDAANERAAQYDKVQMGIDTYEAFQNGESYTSPTSGAVRSPEDGWKVVGSPYDTSWRRMTDEEVEAILAKGKPDLLNSTVEEYQAYQAAEAEAQAGKAWDVASQKTLYYDYYKYFEEVQEENKEFSKYNGDMVVIDKLPGM